MQARKERINRALDIFESVLGVERLIDDDLATKPNDKINIVYLSELYKAFNEKRTISSANMALKRAIERAMHLDQLMKRLQRELVDFDEQVSKD